MRTAFLLVVVLLLLQTIPSGNAQLPPTPLDPIITGAQSNRTQARESVVGEALSREDIDVTLDMEFRDVDFDTIHVIFGGGKFSANAMITARIDMRVLAAERVEQAIEAAAPGTSNVTAVGLSETRFIPADVFRSTLAGEALKIFQDEQAARLSSYISKTIPNVTVLNARFEWSNVTPQDSYEGGDVVPTRIPPEVGDVDPNNINDPTFPPITLVAVINVEYLDRTNLLDIMERVFEPKSEREKARKEQVSDKAAAYDRSAFGLLGIRQVLDLQAFSGWNIIVNVRLPEGYTFEEASPDVFLASDLREAQVFTLGKDAEAPVLNPVSLTLSNRFMVSSALLGAILLCGVILRFPISLAANFWRRKMRR